ncbi:ankyrin repeat domain-containing protein [Ramlibacter sp. PS4R-6]|uniref:ankyrin repeat domain-containing protein n=1 Tax=Ramlibacter sp. PS4R-6 TaxID=3133438 RepID=UPI0030B0AD2B
MSPNIRRLLAALALLGACSAFAADPPKWNVQELQAMLVSAQHHAGASGFEFRSLVYRQEREARLASFSGLPKGTQPRTVGNLVEAHPALRRTLAGMYTPGARSKPIETILSTGERVWVVVELVRRFPATVVLEPGPAFEAWAASMLNIRNLATPDRLLADPVARAQAALWQARSAMSIAVLPAGIDVNLRFGDETTPLTRAIMRRDLLAVQALVDRGADVNACGSAGCPLDIASAVLATGEWQTWLAFFLSKGARVDAVDPKFASSSDTLLTLAILRKNDALAQQLMDLGASPDGAPGVRMTPLQAAVLMGRKPLAETMLAKGAEPLAFSDRAAAPAPVMRYSAYMAAVENGDPQLVAWAESVSIATAKARPASRYRLHIEQDGKIISLTPDGAYTLRAAPFKLVVRFEDPAQGDLQVGASLSPDWLQEVRGGDRRNAMFRPYAAGALPEASKEDSYVLLTADPCAANVGKDDMCDGSFMALQTDAKLRADFHEVREAGREYAREIRTVFNTSQAGKPRDVPLAELKGRTIYMVATTTVNLGSMDGLRFLAPHYLRLQLR